MFRTVVQRRLQSTLAVSKENGIQGLLSAEGVQTAYFARLEHHRSKLNDLVKAKKYSNESDVEQYANKHATDSVNKDIFQHASSLYNLQFAYQRLGYNRDPSVTQTTKPSSNTLLETPKENKDILNPPSGDLLRLIESNFGSVEEFKTLLLQSANAINGDGYTWVVAQPTPISSNLKTDYKLNALNVVNTYNAGSPRNFSAAQITKFKKTLQRESQAAETEGQSTILSLEKIEEFSTTRDNFIPILALDASPKAYLKDYGVFGKAAYLENLWNSIDWDIIQAEIKTYFEKKNVTLI